MDIYFTLISCNESPERRKLAESERVRVHQRERECMQLQTALQSRPRPLHRVHWRKNMCQWCWCAVVQWSMDAVEQPGNALRCTRRGWSYEGVGVTNSVTSSFTRKLDNATMYRCPLTETLLTLQLRAAKSTYCSIDSASVRVGVKFNVTRFF